MFLSSIPLTLIQQRSQQDEQSLYQQQFTDRQSSRSRQNRDNHSSRYSQSNELSSQAPPSVINVQAGAQSLSAHDTLNLGRNSFPSRGRRYSNSSGRDSLPSRGRHCSNSSHSRGRYQSENDEDGSLVHSSASTFVSRIGRSRSGQEGSVVSGARLDEALSHF